MSQVLRKPKNNPQMAKYRFFAGLWCLTPLNNISCHIVKYRLNEYLYLYNEMKII